MNGFGPDRVALSRWLCSGQVVDHAGHVISWHNELHRGFPYPEAAALWLSWSAWRRAGGASPVPRDAEAIVAGRLASELSTTGAVGRDGVAYLFDSCVALDALVRASSAAESALDDEAWVRACAGLGRFLEADSPVLPPAGAAPRWSEEWGLHLNRAAALLARAAGGARRPEALELARAIRERCTRTNGQGGRRYLHAVAYAVEGELLARALGEPAGPLAPGEEVEALARLQRPDGGLPAWSDGSGGARTDVTAQAIRLWTALDRRGFAAALTRALDFLARNQSPEGGLIYESGGGDRNTWSTIFADQALAWASGDVDLRGLI
jgi:hypothetical protein